MNPRVLLAASAALALCGPAAHATTWDFVETGCQAINNSLGCLQQGAVPITLGQVIATFSSPDQSGHHTSAFNEQEDSVTASGDPNFTFEWDHWGGGLLSPVDSATSDTTPGHVNPCYCSYAITWDGAPTSFDYFQPGSSTSITPPFGWDSVGPLIGSMGSVCYDVGSDGTVRGGGDHDGNPSRICGNWVDLPVGAPEPGTLPLLAAPVVLLGLLRGYSWSDQGTRMSAWWHKHYWELIDKAVVASPMTKLLEAGLTEFEGPILRDKVVLSFRCRGCGKLWVTKQ